MGRNRSDCAISILLLVMESSTVMGESLWQRQWPIKDNGLCFSFSQTHSIHFSFLCFFSFLASSFLLLASFPCWSVSQFQVSCSFTPFLRFWILLLLILSFNLLMGHVEICNLWIVLHVYVIVMKLWIADFFWFMGERNF